jgi:menaquinol-cytochrome c reductase cytochrome b subunit
MAQLTQGRLKQRLTDNRVWKSISRHGYPDTTRNRILAVRSNVFLHLHPSRVKEHGLKITYTWGLGGTSLLLFLILSVTGILLMFYYVPSVERAYSDMQALSTSVTFGAFLRNLHRWSAHAMVLVVFLHLCRVFYTGAYKPPREFNWVIGVALFLLTLLMSFTGYLLPWDQLAYWAITVGTGIAGYTPLVGDMIRFILLGGFEVGQPALIRFYTLHIIALPAVACVLMAVHFWRVRKDGGISSPDETDEETVPGQEEDAASKSSQPKAKGVLVWPDLLLLEFLGALGVTLLLFLFSLLRNAPLEEMASALHTPNPAKAPWYFLNLQELLLHMDPALAGVLIPAGVILALMAIPYIDNTRRGLGIWFTSPKGRKIALFSAIYSAVLVVGLILFDAYVAGRRPGGAIKALTGWPEALVGWSIPLAVIGVLSAVLVLIVRWRWQAGTREVLIALFTAFTVTYFVLIISDLLFRGPGMELYWPWAMPDGYNPLDGL